MQFLCVKCLEVANYYWNNNKYNINFWYVNNANNNYNNTFDVHISLIQINKYITTTTNYYYKHKLNVKGTTKVTVIKKYFHYAKCTFLFLNFIIVSIFNVHLMNAI